jgi:hypothetical protein
MTPMRPSIVGSARFKSDRPESAKKLPPAIRKLANYEYRNLQLSQGSMIPTGLITKSAIMIKRKSCRILEQVCPIIDLTRADGIMMIDLTKNKLDDNKEIIDLTVPEEFIIDLMEEDKPKSDGNQDSSLSEEIMSKQCHFTAFDRSNMDDRNFLLPYDEFVSFLDTNFICKKCKTNNEIVYERQTYGIANSINMVCSCRSIGSIKARMRKNASHLPKWKDYTLTIL